MKRNPKKLQKTLDKGQSAIQNKLSDATKTETPKLGDERFNRLISEIDGYAIIILDLKGIITSWNKGAEKIKGYAAEEIIGKNFRIFYSKEDKETHLPDKILNEAFENGSANHEGWRICKDGTRFWGSITLNALHNDAGEVTGFLKMTKDLTEKKIAEDQLSNFMKDLKQKNEELKESEHRYHKMVSEVRDYAIILLDIGGKILDWNKGAEALKGYTNQEIIGKSFRLFYSKEDKDAKLPDQLLKEAASQGSVNHEGWRIRKDGTRFWGNVVITALHDDALNIIGFSKVTRDLSAKKIAEDQLSNFAEELKQKNEELRQSEERYHKMISEVQDYAIIFLSRTGEIENWNAGAEYIKGYTAKEIIGKNFRLFYTPEDNESGLPGKLLDEAVRFGRALHEGWRIKKNGSKFWGSIVITALHNNQGNVIGFSKVTRDLTAKKAAEDDLKAGAAQLELKNKMLERLNEELSSFTYIASHDLKEPLRKIQIFAERLTEISEFPESGKNALDKIKNSAKRMQKLIEDLLSYSIVSNDIKIETIDLNQTLLTVKNDLELVINERKAVIQSTDLPTILGMPFQLHQLFLNLISNSIKFSKPDEAPVVQISARIINDPDIPIETIEGHTSHINYHQLTFKDNGIGFESKYATKIFDAFQRLHPKNTFSGTGIGLAIVKKVVENHNGVVVSEGQPDVGATFSIYLPLIDQ